MKQQIKLVEVLKTFDSVDWRKVDRQLEAYCSKGSDIRKLFVHFRRNSKNGKEFIDLDHTQQALFPSITRKSFYNILSRLQKFVDDHLVLQQIEKSRKAYGLLLLEAYNDRGLYHQFNLMAVKLKNWISQSSRVDVSKKEFLYKINHLHFFSDNPYKGHDGKKLLDELSSCFVDYVSNLRRFYETTILYFQSITSGDFDLNLINLRKLPLEQDQEPTARWLIQLHSLQVNQSESDFREMRTIFLNEKQHADAVLRSATLLILIRYAVVQHKKGRAEYLKELHQFYNVGLEEQLLFVNGILPSSRLINAIAIAGAIGLPEKGSDLLNIYGKYLNPKQMDETKQVGLAQIAFDSQSYDEVISLLGPVNARAHSANGLRARWLLLCSFFEMYIEDEEFLMSQIKNFESMLYNNRNKISQANFTGGLNLAKILKWLLKGNSLHLIEELISNGEDISLRSWLTNRIKGEVGYFPHP